MLKKMRSGNAGFTLVELIVVIAILAILGSIGTVGYSGYIKKTNETADLTLIAEVEQALILGAYSKQYPAGTVVGAVGLSKDANAAISKVDGVENEEINAMLTNSFGSGWRETLQLKGDFYAESDAANILAAMQGVNAKYFGSVPESSFYSTEGATEDLAAKVDEVAGAFKGIIGDDNQYTFSNFWGTDFKNAVNESGLDITDGQTAANLTVMAAANAIAQDQDSHEKWIESWSDDSKTPPVNSTDNGYVAPLVMKYAKYVSLVSYVNDPANNVDPDDVANVNVRYSQLVTAMGNLNDNSGDSSYIDGFNAAIAEFEKKAVAGKSYYSDWQNTQAKTDAEAFIASMAAVNSLQDTYVNKDKADVVNQQDAFTKFGAAGILDSMVNYAKTGELPDGDYVIVLAIDKNGLPVITPTVQE